MIGKKVAKPTVIPQPNARIRLKPSPQRHHVMQELQTTQYLTANQYFKLDLKGFDVSKPVRTTLKFHEFKNLDLHYYHPMEKVVNSIIQECLTLILTRLNLCKTFHKNFKSGRKSAKDYEFQKLTKDWHLSPQQIQDFEAYISRPEANLKQFRLSYNYNQSGDYLTYEHAQLINQTKNYQSKFTSRYPTDDITLDYNRRDEFEISLRVVQQLTKLNRPPTMNYFKKICDYLHHHKLIMYESVILKNLVDFKFRASLLADQIPPKLLPMYYQPVIQQQPDFLVTLIKYFMYNRDFMAVGTLFSFLHFDELSASSKITSSSSSSAVGDDGNIPRCLSIDHQCIHELIDQCIKFEQFTYIPHLLKKLIYCSVDKTSVLFSINNKFKLNDQLLINRLKPEDVIVLMLNETISNKLVRVINHQSNDDKQWLLNVLQIYFRKAAPHSRGLITVNALLNTTSSKLDTPKSDDVDFELVFKLQDSVDNESDYERTIGIKSDINLSRPLNVYK